MAEEVVQVEVIDEEKEDGKVKQFFKKSGRTIIEVVSGAVLLAGGIAIGLLFAGGDEEPEEDDDDEPEEEETPFDEV